ncbi:MAG: Holliday junction ATP-dependent DNA helicase RuvA [Patescibacteria group bacterium]|nr:MAG: Holliday junction ATP-dependent DNA helicase RuvA [Patescibacteria group bacterium]
MINYLEGEILDLSPNTVTILTPAGIGFEVNIHSRIYKQLISKKKARLKTKLIIKENSFAFYAFSNQQEEYLFFCLEKIHKIGHKTAYNIIRFAEAQVIIEKIKLKDIDFFEQIPGVGKKSARKIVIETIEKIEKDPDIKNIIVNEEDQLLISALQNLGFETSRINRVIPKLTTEAEFEQKLKKALKLLNKEQ